MHISKFELEDRKKLTILDCWICDHGFILRFCRIHIGFLLFGDSTRSFFERNCKRNLLT